MIDYYEIMRCKFKKIIPIPFKPKNLNKLLYWGNYCPREKKPLIVISPEGRFKHPVL